VLLFLYLAALAVWSFVLVEGWAWLRGQMAERAMRRAEDRALARERGR
jgi:hypothetical protein